MAFVKREAVQTALGSGLAVVVDQVWRRVEGTGDRFPPLEHEHWGLVSLLVASRVPRARYYGLGFGTTLILEKLSYPDPLGSTATPAERTGIYGLDSLLGGLLIMSVSWK